jgi:hypothetical protein
MAGVAAVPAEAGEKWSVTQIFAPGPAIEALAASAAKPRHPDARADRVLLGGWTASDHAPDDFVARNDWQRTLNVAVDDVQVGPANATGRDLDEQVEAVGARERPLDRPQRLAGTVELHRPQDRFRHDGGIATSPG